MAKRITVKVPVRIDLAGGWTDVPAYCTSHMGEVVNIAIDQYVTATCDVDEQRKIKVTYQTDMPTGCGLGTSGAMNVALIAAIRPLNEDPAHIAEKAYQFEAVLGNTGGRQDQWASAFGGVQHLCFEGHAVRRTSLKPSVEFTDWLRQHLMLFDTGLPHVSGDLHQSVWERYAQGEEAVTEGLNELQRAGRTMHMAIAKEQKTVFSEALRSVMNGVELLNPALHAPFRSVLEPLEASGEVIAWKAMGAGGGGVVGVLRNQGIAAAQRIKKAAESVNWTHLEWNIDFEGLQRTEIINHG